MNLRPQRRRSAEINIAVTPLIDVILVLLIFFMVSTHFKDEARLKLQLPKATGEAPHIENSALIKILIDSNGQYIINGQVINGLNPDNLTAVLIKLIKSHESNQQPPVLIQADARTPHQAVMTALDALKRVGLSQVAFAAIRPLSQNP